MKKTLSMILILLLLVGLVPEAGLSSALMASDAVDMVIHYHRFDGNYEGWNLWIWAKGKDGSSYEFSSEDAYGKKAEFRVEGVGNAEEIGFIVRKGEWEAKDVEADRFVPISKQNAEGVLEIFLVQGAERIYYSEDEIDLSPKFLKASFIDEKAVKLETSKPISATDLREKFAVVGENGELIRPVAISSGVSDVAQNFVVLLESAVTVGMPYVTSYIDYEALSIETSGLYDTAAFREKFTYSGELGAIYRADGTIFRVWAPTAKEMTLNLYEKGNGGAKKEGINMVSIGSGVWEASVTGDLHGTYYTYSVNIAGKVTETYDPYANAAGVNGDRSMVVDLKRTNPAGWGEVKGPVYAKSNDIIVYELHIRDLSTHVSSNIKNVGKYLGVIEANTKTKENGSTTGLDHIKELGVTHVQILPMYDYNSIDETRLEDNVFNWGYDPKNYNVPEGSYSTDPYNGEVRINEMKQMIQGLHNEGIGVIMDVVYNHTALSADSNLSILAPNYYYRMVDGKYSNASGTGNETASEREMVRKLIIDSLKYWVTEYHIDGFRFDLMGVHDTETMRLIDVELRKINPDIILYGEGWTGGSSPLAEGKRLVKANILDVERIGAFNDDFRDGVKGHVFNAKEAGFANGAPGFEESVKFGIVGAVYHPGVDYKLVNYSKKPWANAPSQSVNYVSAHDNLTLWDKLLETNPEASDEERIAMHKLSNTIVLTSQGMPFLHAGVDFLRSKGGDHNSYKSPDEVNWLDWSLKDAHGEVFEYYKGLIAVRKAYPAFRMATQEEIEANLMFFDGTDASVVKLEPQMIGYSIAKGANGSAEDMVVLFNGSFEPKTVMLPEGQYKVLVNADKADPDGVLIISGGEYVMPASSALVLEKTEAIESPIIKKGNQDLFLLYGIIGLVLMLGLAIYLKKKK